MARVLAKVFSPVYHVSLAPKVVYAVWNALCVYILLSTRSKVFAFLKAVRLLNTILKHSTRLLAEGRMFFTIRFCILNPKVLN